MADRGRAAHPINLEKVELLKLAPGEISWKRSDGRLVKLFHPGQLVLHEFLNRFKEAKREIIYDYYVHPELMAKLYECFSDLKNATEEKVRVECRDELLKIIKPIYWQGLKEGSLLDLVIVCEKIFSRLNDEHERLFYQTSEILLRRSYLLSALNVVFALSVGYVNFYTLQDIYHLGFFLDFSLDRENLSYAMMQAIFEEQRNSGGGIELLANYNEDKAKFLAHCKESYALAKQQASQYFHNPSILKLIMKHHEKINGGGFPNRLCHKEVSDLESIVIFLSNTLDFACINYKKDDGCSFLESIVTQKGKRAKSVLTSRLKLLFYKTFSSLEMEEDGYEKLKGA